MEQVESVPVELSRDGDFGIVWKEWGRCDPRQEKDGWQVGPCVERPVVEGRAKIQQLCQILSSHVPGKCGGCPVLLVRWHRSK